MPAASGDTPGACILSFAATAVALDAYMQAVCAALLNVVINRELMALVSRTKSKVREQPDS